MPTPQVIWKPFLLASSGTVTNATVNSARMVNSLYKGCVIVANRTAEAGTSPTFDWKLQGYHRVSNTWYDVPSASGVQYTTGQTGVRTVVVYPGIVADDADGSVTISTNYKNVSAWLPYEFRIVVTHGGTSIANTFAITVEPLL